MTQQEIKANMTQGTWVVDPAGYSFTDFGVISKKYAGGTFVAGRCNNNFKELSTCNTLAITHAINNTYGKGINPESVPDMFNALNIVHKYLTNIGSYETAMNIKNILNKATL